MPDRIDDLSQQLHNLQVYQAELEMQNEELRQAKHALEISQAQYMELYDQAPLAYITINKYGQIERANLTFSKMIGVPRESVLRQSLTRYIFPEDQDICYLILRKPLGDGVNESWEMRMIRFDGSVFWAHLLCQKLPCNECRITINDITERKHAFSSLDYVNECFNQALNGANHILYRLNVKKGGYDYLSPAAERILGITYAEVLKYNLEQVFDRIHPDDRVRISTLIDDAIRTRTSNTIDLEPEYRFRKNDGEYSWLLDSTRLVVDDAGEIQYFFGSAYDMTGQKLQEEALQQSEQMARAILSSTNDLILYLSTDGTIIQANEVVAKRFGHTIDTFVGTNIFTYFTGEVRRIREQNLARTVRTRIPFRYEDERAGSFFDHCMFPIFNTEKSVVGVTIFSREITEKKNFEVALKRANEELESRVNERTASLSAATERIRQISFQLLKAEEQERIRIASELHDQVGQSLLLAKMKIDALACNTESDVTDVSSADISKLLEVCIQDIRTLTFSMRPHLLDTAGLESALEWLCKSIYENYQVKIYFSTNRLTIHLDSAHRYSLYQAVRELLLNVVKHAGVNYAELSINTKGNHLMIQVSDNGNGFELTSQSGTAVSGIGLGLFNVQQRIESMGGSCRFNTKPGQGTVVTITIQMGE